MESPSEIISCSSELALNNMSPLSGDICKKEEQSTIHQD